MMNRPALTITLCGIASQADEAAIQMVEQSKVEQIKVEQIKVEQIKVEQIKAEQSKGDGADDEREAKVLAAAMQGLAVSRGKVVTGWFVDAGVAVERLFSCRPQVLADDSAPRVMISL